MKETTIGKREFRNEVIYKRMVGKADKKRQKGMIGQKLNCITVERRIILRYIRKEVKKG